MEWLERRSPRLRLAMVEEIEEFQSPVLYELVMAKSRELEPANPAEAECAELARRMPELGREDRRESRGTAAKLIPGVSLSWIELSCAGGARTDAGRS